MKILLTAFDAFGGEAINPAWEAVQRVQAPQNVVLMKVQVPTVFGKSLCCVAQAMQAEQPDVVLCIGQAGGRANVTPERVAINVMDATIPDNAGNWPVDEPIIPGGENALFATVPIKAMVTAAQTAGLPAQLSNTAGTFVCNQLLYGVLDLCQKEYPHTKAGFIHVPYLPEQTVQKPNMPSLSLDCIVQTLEKMIAALVQAETC